jgi:hypothetical protein
MSQYPPNWEIEKGGPAVGEKQDKTKQKTKTKHDKKRVRVVGEY